MQTTLQRATRALLVTATIALAACDSNDAPAVTDPTYTPVATTVQLADLGVVRDGDTTALVATVKDQRGRVMSGATVRFAVSDTTIAVIGTDNRLLARREGTVEIIAVSGTAQQRLSLRVQLQPAVSIDVSTTALMLLASDQRQVQATLRGLDNRVLNRPLAWESSNSNVARVDSTGRITAVAPGTARISVRYGTLVRVISVDVGGYSTLYNLTSIDGRALPASTYEEVITRPDGSSYTLIERLESGTVTFGDRYQVTMTVADIERSSFQGNVIERVIRRRQVRDNGQVEYNWLNGAARLLSEAVGGLSHQLVPRGVDLQLDFRIGGTNTIWSLGLRR